jgi:hypothetical protein
MANDREAHLWIAAPHPACLDEDALMRACTMLQTRRGGPGGQHRNKTSTTIVVTHKPTGVVAEASERRSQVDNRRVAIRRLREELAIRVRTDPNAKVAEVAITDDDEIEPIDWPAMMNAYRQQHGGAKLRMSEANVHRPSVLAVLLDDLVAEAGSTQPVAKQWNTSTSQLVRFLKEFPTALEMVNQLRKTSNLSPLR